MEGGGSDSRVIHRGEPPADLTGATGGENKKGEKRFLRRGLIQRGGAIRVQGTASLPGVGGGGTEEGFRRAKTPAKRQRRRGVQGGAGFGGRFLRCLGGF